MVWLFTQILNGSISAGSNPAINRLCALSPFCLCSMQCAGQSSNAPRDWNPESYCDEMPGEPPLEWTLALFCLQGSFITVRELFGANLLDNLLSRSSSVEFHSLIVFFFPTYFILFYFFLSFLAPHSTFSSPRKRPAIHSFDAKGSIVKNFSPDLGG